MDRSRPDPDQLLAAAKEAEQAGVRGKLKVFFGAAAGVGKTYTMLEEARRRRAEGIDVVVGIVETHQRAETERLLEGLEVLPRATYAYRGVAMPEFDLDGAIRRHPALLLVDELAHSNVPGGRHPKRWQDVQEILEAGIDVYTTINVQHLESVNDLVAQITGVAVRETVPDALFDQAGDVELVDLTPDDLLQRFREGKVYFPAQATRAMENFFSKGNLIALRELSLRRMADRVEGQRESFRLAQAVEPAPPLAERLMVAVSPSPFAPRVVRAARRLAERLHAAWVAVYVETPSVDGLTVEDKDRVFQTLRLAEQLGAETATLTGDDPAAEFLRYARQRGVNRIIVGKPGRPRWRDRLGNAFVDDLIRNDAGIDVYVVRGQMEEVVRHHERTARVLPRWGGYLGMAGVMALCTLVAWPITHYFFETSSAMLYVLGTVVVALVWGRGPSIAASLLGVLCYDFFFIPPYFSITVGNLRHLFTFLVILVVGNVIAALALKIKRQADIARAQEQRTEAMYRMTRDLAAGNSREALIEIIEQAMAATFGTDAVLFLPDSRRQILVQPGKEPTPSAPQWRLTMVKWVLDHAKPAGFGTDTFPSADSLYLPLQGNRGTVGVLGLRVKTPDFAQDPERMLLLETLARHAAIALEQQDLEQEASEARMLAEAERLQTSLLSSVSHDLRTPLASITGAASSLLEGGEALAVEQRCELVAMIHQEADRLSRLVTNLLQATRLESGALRPNCDWQSAQELVGAALERMAATLDGRHVTVGVPNDLPLLYVDALLVEQVLLNLLDNAVKHTSAGTPIEITGRVENEMVVLTVADRGPGLAPGAEEKVFEKFFRGLTPGAPTGSGLGLTIVRGFVEVHGGKVAAYNRPEGGAAFEIRFPVKPAPVLEEMAVLGRGSEPSPSG